MTSKNQNEEEELVKSCGENLPWKFSAETTSCQEDDIVPPSLNNNDATLAEVEKVDNCCRNSFLDAIIQDHSSNATKSKKFNAVENNVFDGAVVTSNLEVVKPEKLHTNNFLDPKQERTEVDERPYPNGHFAESWVDVNAKEDEMDIKIGEKKTDEMDAKEDETDSRNDTEQLSGCSGTSELSNSPDSNCNLVPSDVSNVLNNSPDKNDEKEKDNEDIENTSEDEAKARMRLPLSYRRITSCRSIAAARLQSHEDKINLGTTLSATVENESNQQEEVLETSEENQSNSDSVELDDFRPGAIAVDGMEVERNINCWDSGYVNYGDPESLMGEYTSEYTSRLSGSGIEETKEEDMILDLPPVTSIRAARRDSLRSVGNMSTGLSSVASRDGRPPLEDSSTVAEIISSRRLKNEVLEDILKDASIAQVVPEDDDKTKRIRALTIFSGFSIVVIVGLVFVGYIWKWEKPAKENTLSPRLFPSVSPTLLPEAAPTNAPTNAPLTLSLIKSKGEIRCGVKWFIPFEKDLCHALAAAVFGNSSKAIPVITPLADRWAMLQNGSLDVITMTSTHTMERDVFQEDTKSGFTFSTPFFYDGIAFAGDPKYVANCTNKLDTTFGECKFARVCASRGSTALSFAKDVLPDLSVRAVEQDQLYQSLIDGKCNVIVGMSSAVSLKNVQEVTNTTFRGPYSVGDSLFVNEPLSMVTRQNDPEWSSFVNWIIHALLAAEEHNITQSNAETMTTTDVFGPEFEKMFIHAIAAVGNYREMYERHLESYMPEESKLNLLNDGSSGLIYSFPFGAWGKLGPEPQEDSVLSKIAERKSLRCGLLPFVHSGNSSWGRMGLDRDYCRALSASILRDENFDDQITFMNFSTPQDGFSALNKGEIDVLSGIPISMEVDVKEPTTGQGFTFSQAYFYEENESGQVDAIALVTQEEDVQWSDFVYWVVSATFYAEDKGILKDSAATMPTEVQLFGADYEEMFVNAISAVGSYGEMHKRNFGGTAPEGRNSLNANPFGPQHISLLPLS